MSAALGVEKLCKGCGQFLPATTEHFSSNPMGRGGLHSQCKRCMHQRRQARRHANPEKTKAEAAYWSEQHRRKKGARDAKSYRAQREAATDKMCSSCRQTLSKKEFARSKAGTIDGLASWCNECVRTHRTQVRDVQEWANRLVEAARARHKQKKMAGIFDLDAEFLKELLLAQGGECFWFSVPLTLNRRSGLAQATLDRLDPGVGYTRDNVVLACKAANLGRGAESAAAFSAFVKLVEDHVTRS